MIEILKTFFGGSISSLEAWCGGLSLASIITLIGTIFWNVYKGKKNKKEIESVKAENKALLDAFIEEHNNELEALKKALTSDLDNISNMILIEATKSGIDLEKFKSIMELNKKVVKEELLDLEKLEAEKVEQVENEQTKQDEVKEHLSKIDELNGLV